MLILFFLNLYFNLYFIFKNNANMSKWNKQGKWQMQFNMIALISPFHSLKSLLNIYSSFRYLAVNETLT